jgi:hypothetical protein
MACCRLLMAALLATVLGGTAQAGVAAAIGPPSADMCGRAASSVETSAGLPAGLLHAIGLVETGRQNPLAGQFTAWPWAIDVGGKDHWYDGPDAAIDAVRTLQAQGAASIDVGCFQINLLHHPNAFASLEDAFDPMTNATYAARFLLRLRAATGSWDQAIMQYHSADPARGGPYLARVMAHVTIPPATPSPPSASGPTSIVIAGVMVSTPGAVGSAPAIIQMAPTLIQLPIIHR